MQAAFTDGKILLRPYTKDDAVLLYEAAKECLPDANKWMPWCHDDYALLESEMWISSSREKWDAGEEYNFVIIDAITGKFLGGVGLNRLDREYGIANLGYWVRKIDRNRGIAAAAARLAAVFGIRELGFGRIEIVVAVDNHASRQTALKSGAKFEAILRKRLAYLGVAHDAVIYSFIADDFTKSIE